MDQQTFFQWIKYYLKAAAYYLAWVDVFIIIIFFMKYIRELCDLCNTLFNISVALQQSKDTY